MSTRVPESNVEPPGAAEPEPAPAPASNGHKAPKRNRRRARVGAVVLVVMVAAGGVIAVTEPFGSDGRPTTRATVGTALATVKEGPLSTQVDQTGTLSYAGRPDGAPYSVVNQARGIYTWVPAAGDEIKCGRVLYWVESEPVVLLCGSTPAYRNLSRGDEGKDVRALNKNLVDLGYADRDELDPDSDYFGWETTEALLELQDKLGMDETGTLELGQAVFLPGPLRVSKALAKLGTQAAPGAPVAEAKSNTRQVTVNLEASQQAQVKVGDPVQVTLPNNRTTSGKVSRIGAVATASGDSGEEGSGSGSGSSATIPVYITLKNPKDAGNLDQAPVQVQITTTGVKRALIVPVTALVGQAGGGYAVEKVNAQGVHQTVPVTLGLFDHAAGLVQVTGGLTAGDQVVVPTS